MTINCADIDTNDTPAVWPYAVIAAEGWCGSRAQHAISVHRTAASAKARAKRAGDSRDAVVWDSPRDAPWYPDMRPDLA